MFSNYERKVYLQGEQPCGFYINNDNPERYQNAHLKLGDYFDEIYSTCPYSSKWLNLINGYDKYRPTVFPYNLEFAATEEGIPEKEYDVCYWGNLMPWSETVSNILETIVKFNHRYYTLGVGVPHHILKQATGINSPRTEMFNSLRKSKIMPTSNMLYLTDKEVESIKKLPRWQECEAFTHLNQNLLPQQKPRPVEAMMNKTLMLVKQDPWRIMENWFIPDEDFVYYKEDKDLEPKIKEIINDWNSYEHIVENAYNKVSKFHNTEYFFENIKKGTVNNVK
tara:strand:- start:860 stop:1699 length:840 start_codon:yes stop_codon:yes gene_type:complete